MKQDKKAKRDAVLYHQANHKDTALQEKIVQEDLVLQHQTTPMNTAEDTVLHYTGHTKSVKRQKMNHQNQKTREVKMEDSPNQLHSQEYISQ